MSFPFNNPLVRRCPKGHPIDNNEPCGYCAQEEKNRAEQDDKLVKQITRLAEDGKLDHAVLYAFTRLCCREDGVSFDASLAVAIERIISKQLLCVKDDPGTK